MRDKAGERAPYLLYPIRRNLETEHWTYQYRKVPVFFGGQKMMKKNCWIVLLVLLMICVSVGCRRRTDGLRETFIPGESDQSKESQNDMPSSSASPTDGNGGINVNLDDGKEEESEEAPTDSGIERDYSILMPDLPVVTDSAAFCVIDDAEQVIAGKKMLDRMVPASLTKVLTALIVYEKLPMDQVVKVTEQEISEGIPVMSSGVSPSLRAGEEFTVRDLLYILILSSANTAGNILADAAAGSTEAFAALMNEKCASLGLTHSHFSNAHGLDANDHYSCAYDMAVILRNAISVPELSEILRTTEYTVPATEYVAERTLTMGHSMISSGYTCEGVIGGKTGWTIGAKSTLLTAFSRNGKNYYICTMNSDEGLHYQDTDNLANTIYAAGEGIVYDTHPVSHDAKLVASDAEGVVIRFTVDNANASSRTAWWNTQLGTAAAVFMDLGELHGENEIRLPFPEPGTYAVQLFGKNGSGVERGIMIYVLYTGEMPSSGVVNFRGEDYIIDDNGLMKVGEPEMSYGTYCTDANGCVLKNTITDDGYFAGSKGKLLKGWQDFSGGKYYFQPDGRMATGRMIIDGKTYEFSDSGVLQE